MLTKIMFYYLFRIVYYTLAWLDLILFTALVYGLSFLPLRRSQGLYHKIYRHWSRVFVRAVGVELYLHQHNLKPIPKQYILVANHPSCFEDVGVPALFDVYSLAKIEVKKWTIVGRIAKAAGTIFVERESRQSRNASVKKLIAALKDGKNIAIYPEGGCKGRRINYPFSYGAFDISLKTGIPIIPVFLHYEAQEDFEWMRPSLLKTIWCIFTAKNKRANFHLYDALQPSQFNSKEEYCLYVYNQFVKWQEQHLE